MHLFKKNKSGCSNPVTNELLKDGIEQSLEIANNYEIDLDFTVDSLLNVDDILLSIHGDYIETKDDEGLNGLALMFALYIVEVIKRQNDNEGILYRDHSEFGKNTFPFLFKGRTLFIYGWCQKRIFDGEDDSIHFKYKASIEG